MKSADELGDAFVEIGQQGHWLPEALAPVLRVAASEIRRRRESKVSRKMNDETQTGWIC
jgi:hypothetical protein